jgi:hypothetical protein
MKAFSDGCKGSVLLLAGGGVGAQIRDLQGVGDRDSDNRPLSRARPLTIKNDKGDYETLVVPEDMARFSALKIGDKITARYYENVVVRFKKPGEAAVDLDQAALTTTPGQKPGGTAATQRTITATVTAIDPKVPSITVKGPGWTLAAR